MAGDSELDLLVDGVFCHQYKIASELVDLELKLTKIKSVVHTDSIGLIEKHLGLALDNADLYVVSYDRHQNPLIEVQLRSVRGHQFLSDPSGIIGFVGFKDERFDYAHRLGKAEEPVAIESVHGAIARLKDYWAKCYYPEAIHVQLVDSENEYEAGVNLPDLLVLKSMYPNSRLESGVYGKLWYSGWEVPDAYVQVIIDGVAHAWWEGHAVVGGLQHATATNDSGWQRFIDFKAGASKIEQSEL